MTTFLLVAVAIIIVVLVLSKKSDPSVAETPVDVVVEAPAVVQEETASPVETSVTAVDDTIAKFERSLSPDQGKPFANLKLNNVSDPGFTSEPIEQEEKAVDESNGTVTGSAPVESEVLPAKVRKPRAKTVATSETTVKKAAPRKKKVE